MIQPRQCARSANWPPSVPPLPWEGTVNALHVSRSADLPPVGEMAELAPLWAWTLPLALLGSWTCFGELPGVNWALWTTASAAGFLVVSRRSERSHTDRYPRAALLLACLLSIAAAISANPRADALIFLSVAGLFAFAVLSTAARSGEMGVAALARAPLDVCRLLFAEAAARVAATFAVIRMRHAIPVVRASTIAAALAATLFLLLSAADPTLASWRDVAWETVLSRMFLPRDVFFVVLQLLLLGGYGLAARRSEPLQATQGSNGSSPPARAALFADTERLIVLVAANVARYEGTGKMDVSYLERLARSSPDALPALVAALPKLSPADASRLRESLRHAPLDRSILLPPPGTGGLSWYEWSLRRAAAQSALRAAGLLGEAPTR